MNADQVESELQEIIVVSFIFGIVPLICFFSALIACSFDPIDWRYVIGLCAAGTALLAWSYKRYRQGLPGMGHAWNVFIFGMFCIALLIGGIVLYFSDPGAFYNILTVGIIILALVVGLFLLAVMLRFIVPIVLILILLALIKYLFGGD
jgi:hypothetical protein